ncbi:Gfo/Idh/MocA family protein [Paenibacillus sp. 1P07SE]|uniref:Gfo/Idh/MocA family protein n=1 Tax=Paenibacillus sp. 1P07SE TaxID=3132209 RepID=UPI0039A752DD
MSKRVIRFGVIGCGLMGKEFASAAARWLHLTGVDFVPVITAVCDANPAATAWFEEAVPSVKRSYTDYKELLADPEVDAVYCAVPHNLHADIYADIIRAGKHLLGEKPFGIDREANADIMRVMAEHPEVVVRCSSEFPFFPGAMQVLQWVKEGRFGRIIEVEAGFWHSSDMNPDKPINWKRRVATNGEYGCMGDLGMHVLHLPMRFGWRPRNVRSLLTKVMEERPDGKGGMAPCETWDNAILACEVRTDEQSFPMVLSTKRIAPGHANTWFIRIQGTAFSAEFSTKNPKQVAWLPYEPGGEQAWHVMDAPYQSAYGTITGGIFEFGFSDSILQMWAAFCDEIANGREGMSQPFHCATPEEAEGSHKVFTAALESGRTGATIELHWGE